MYFIKKVLHLSLFFILSGQFVHAYSPIDVKLDFKAQKIHRVDTLIIQCYTILLILAILTIWIFKVRRFKYIHETGLFIIYGLIAGALLKYVGDQNTEFTYLRVVPSGLNQQNNSIVSSNQTLLNQNSTQNQTNELIISTSTRNLTNLIRNLSSKPSNRSFEKLNSDYPLNNLTNLNESNPFDDSISSKNKILSSSKDKILNSSKDKILNSSTDVRMAKNIDSKSQLMNDLKSTTIKQTNSTLEVTTQEAAPFTENDLKPTKSFNEVNFNNSLTDPLIKPTLSSIQNNQTNDTPKKMINKSDKESKESTTEEQMNKIESNENNLNKLIKMNKDNRNELTLKVPPDSLYLNLKIDDKSQNMSSNKNYVYLFKGELVNHHNDDQTATDLYISQKAVFDPEFFFNLIPLIVFNAGYSLKRRYFFRNLGAIFSFSVFGTIISCFTIASVLWTFMLLVPTKGFTFVDCLYFGALISSTDTVTILQFFNQLNVDVNLYALVLGESVLSDAVVIVLVKSIDLFEKEYLASSIPTTDQSLLLSAIHSISNFAYIFTLSILIGFLAGILNALITKFSKLKEFYLLECSLFVLISYSAFLVSELLEFSGIVTILFCGIAQAHYNFLNLSKESKFITVKFTELLSFLAENFIFSYLGVSMFINPQHRYAISIIIFSFIAIIIGRLFNIYPLSFLLNLNRTNKIPLKSQHCLFFSGLRGSMAYALAMQQTISESRQIILTTTSLIIIVTVICGGSLLGSLLSVLNIDTGTQESDQEMQPFSKPTSTLKKNVPNQSNTNLTAKSFNSSIGQKVNNTCYITQQVLDEKAWLVKKWYFFDCKVLKPLLTNSTPSLVETLPNLFLPLSRLLTTNEQLNNALNSTYTDACGFNNVNFTGIATDGDLIEEQSNVDRNSNYQRYSFENTNFEESYLSFGLNDNNEQQRLNEILERSVGQLVQNSDNAQQTVIFDRLASNNQHTKSNK